MGRFLGQSLTLTLFCYATLTADDLETTTKQLAGHVLVINDTLYLIVHHLVQMLCTNLDCLCWLAAMLDLRENRAFAMEGFMGIFNCRQEGYKRTYFRWETLYSNFVQSRMFIYPTSKNVLRLIDRRNVVVKPRRRLALAHRSTQIWQHVWHDRRGVRLGDAITQRRVITFWR